MNTALSRLLHRLRPRPRLSIVLIVYRMPEQAERTLYTLAPQYQREVAESEYEVIVVENRSERMLGATRAARHAGNVRYFEREESQRTPVHAIAFGAEQARGTHIAIMIDGARMLTPGIVRLSLDAFRVRTHAAVITPGYHLGHKLQQEAVNEGYDEAVETALLADIAWPQDGYRLFDIAVLSGSCIDGFFLPNPESNFIATSLARWRAIGGIDTRYDDFGGGYANIDLYKRLLEFPDTPCYLLFGEGTFHQFHGGVTTGTRGDERSKPDVPVIFFGTAPRQVLRFIRHSLDQADNA